MTSSRNHLAWFLVPFLVLLSSAQLAVAGKFSPGDVVQVYDDWKKAWINGTVIDMNRRGELLIETASGSSLSQKVYNPRVVRFAYEDGAIAPSRLWKDASGQFEITAAPIAIYGDTLKIRKPDMTEQEVPISKLGDLEQRFIEKLRAQYGGAVTPTPDNMPIEHFTGDLLDDSVVSPFGDQDQRIALFPDPLPAYMRLQEGGAAFDRIGGRWEGEEFGVIIPVGGPDSLVLASGEVHPRWSSDSTDPSTRLLWVSIGQKKILRQQKLPPDEYVLDYHPPSHRLLTYSFINGNDKDVALAIWEVLPTDEILKPVIRWEASGDKRNYNDPWAKIIDGNIILQRAYPGEYVAWDLSQKKVAYHLKQESRTTSVPTFSGTNMYAFLPEQDKVRVFDPVSGTVLTALPAPNGSKAVAVSEDGKRAAVLDNNELTVWDLTNASAEPNVYHADDIGRLSPQGMYWLGTDKLVVKSSRELLLFSLTQRVVIWSYQFEYSTKHGNNERPLVHVINDHLVYGASLKDKFQNEGLAVGNVKLPGPKVAEVFGKFDREDLEVMSPGEHVRLEVRCGDQLNHDVYFSLVEKIEKNGWVLDQENPTVVMYADLTRGETQSATYRIFGGASAGSLETVSYTPNRYSLKLMRGDEVLWNRLSMGGLPTYFSIRSDQSLQEVVNKWEVPSASFFKYSDVPARIIKAEYRRGLGTTLVGTRGLIPGELKPPPTAATPSSSSDSSPNTSFGQPASSSSPDESPKSTFGQPAKSTFGQPEKSTFGQPDKSSFGQP
ncbi:hypothetical protein GC197_15615 [bacterium]|nr:hypothetical protein [bacterium]